MKHKINIPLMVYFVMQTKINERGEYIPCLAIEGESGYHETDWHWDCDFETAQRLCDDKNESMGIDKMTAMKIQLSTMKG